MKKKRLGCVCRFDFDKDFDFKGNIAGEIGKEEGEGGMSLRHYDELNLCDSRETGEMEDDQSIVRKWEEMDIDILVKIFKSFDIIELTSGVAHICRVWRMAACDPFLWKTLDLTKLESNFIKIPLRPYVYVADQSDKFLTRLLKISLNLSQGNICSLIFHFNLYLNDDQLTYIAERCPRLRRLVLPAWNRIKVSGIRKAIRTWKDLESLTMPSIENPLYLMEEISKNCNNFRELKIMGPCHVLFANTLVAFLPGLRILSLRCSVLLKEALLAILEGLKNLEVLNISHCLLIDSKNGRPVRARQLDKSILKVASRLREFLTCTNESCTLCKRMMEDEGQMRWYKYEEGLWKQDEVTSLSL